MNNSSVNIRLTLLCVYRCADCVDKNHAWPCNDIPYLINRYHTEKTSILKKTPDSDVGRTKQQQKILRFSFLYRLINVAGRFGPTKPFYDQVTTSYLRSVLAG